MSRFRFRLYRICADQHAAGTLLDDEAQSIIGQGKELMKSKPRKEDIVQE